MFSKILFHLIFKIIWYVDENKGKKKTCTCKNCCGMWRFDTPGLELTLIPEECSTYFGNGCTVEHFVLPLFRRWSPLSQCKLPAGGEKLQRPSLHCVPLANWTLGAVYRGHIRSGYQHICYQNARWRCLLLSGHANPQGHLYPGQCGPGSSQKVRLPLFCTVCYFHLITVEPV